MKYILYILHETNQIIISTLDIFNKESELIQELACIVGQYNDINTIEKKAKQILISGYRITKTLE